MAGKDALEQWTLFCTSSSQQRLPSEKFATLARVVARQNRISGLKIADALLQTQLGSRTSIDPLVTRYIEELLNLHLLDVPEILSALFKRSRYHINSQQDGLVYPLQFEEAVFRLSRRAYAEQGRPRTELEGVRMLKVLSHWMNSLVAENSSSAMVHQLAETIPLVSAEALVHRENFGLLVLCCLQNIKIAGIMRLKLPKEVASELSSALTGFIQLLAGSSLQIAEQININYKTYDSMILQRSPTMPQENGQDEQVTKLQLDSVPDLAPTNSRASLYVYLQAALGGRPIVSDAAVLSYLHARYKNDIQSSIVDLITAAFDVLLNATVKGESIDSTFLIRSFIVNKMPSLLAALLASSFNPLSMMVCMEQAFHQINISSASGLPQDLAIGSDADMRAITRSEFLSAAVTIQLISEEESASLSADGSPHSRVVGRRSKDEWISQYTSDPQKLDRMITAMQATDGNAGPVTMAVTEILTNLCTTKETFSLKSLCNGLSRKPHCLDALALFGEPETLLQPLCSLLDDWKFEEDQGEYQPSYDEFGSITLFVVAFAYRYGLNHGQLPVTDAKAFISQYVDRAYVNQPLDALSEDQQKCLAQWLRALFETEGISDDVMSTCRPQDFYALVPTLFAQCVSACQTKCLKLETLRTGLELLLETFLLPALIGAVTWLTGQLYKARDGNEVVMQVLLKLLKPASLGDDAQQMHSTILSLVAKPLDQALKDMRRSASPNKNVDALLTALEPHLGFQRAICSQQPEIQAWAGVHNAGLLGGIRSVMQSLIMWSIGAGAMPMYTHRQLLVAIELLGAEAVLRVIIDEVKSQTEGQAGPIALDIATALICAPNELDRQRRQPQGSPQRPMYVTMRMTLRDALQVELDKATEITRNDSLRAETIVRLSRKVEAQSVEIPNAELHLPIQDMMQNIELPSAAELAVVPEASAVENDIDFLNADGGLQIDTSGIDMSMDTSAQNLDSANVLASADEDIFAGLGFGVDIDMDLDFT